MKTLFIKSIEALRDQYDIDCNVANKLEQVYGEEIPLYNNALLRNTIFNLLDELLPSKILDIKHFCYELDYGRNSGQSIEELWEEISDVPKVKLPNWFESHTAMMEKLDDITIKPKQIISEETAKQLQDEFIERNKEYKKQDNTVIRREDKVKEKLDVNDIEVTYKVVSPLKGKIFSIEDEL